jgi:hypothetical protein
MPAGGQALCDLSGKGGMKMVRRKKGSFWKPVVSVFLILIGGVFVLSGCSSPPKTLDRSVSGPQVIVNPESIRLGIAKLMATDIVFEGAGFKPGDSIFISLLGPEETKAIVAEAQIKQDGTFRAELGQSSMSKLTKAMEILRGDIEANEKFEPIVVITKPPIPEGTYTVKVTSMLSKQTAETKLNVKGPSIVDRTKDLLGRMLGKIRYKKS